MCIPPLQGFTIPKSFIIPLRGMLAYFALSGLCVFHPGFTEFSSSAFDLSSIKDNHFSYLKIRMLY